MNNLKLRSAVNSDSILLFEWANDKDMRQNSFNSNVIILEDHEIWYNRKLKGINNSAILILELSDKPIGQIRFERSNNCCSIDYFIIKDERGKGYGKEIIKMGIDRVKSLWHNVDCIFAEVKKSNQPSSKVFIDLNFTETSYPDKLFYELKV